MLPTLAAHLQHTGTTWESLNRELSKLGIDQDNIKADTLVGLLVRPEATKATVMVTMGLN